MTDALISAKEEQPVMKNRAANCAAEDVLMKFRGRNELLKVVAGVEEGVAIELEDITVKVVGA
ncbi:MAG: hypothetical protein ACRD3K_07555, partial [Edaphobacter sp.]